LEAWKNKVGGIEAERIKNTAATRGTAMHSYLEMHLNGENLLDLTIEGLAARNMAQTIIDKGLTELHEIWGNEVVLYYPELYAGQTDLCGVYQGRDSIIDFKQSNKPKKDEWIEDYKLQLAAYATAHDCIYGTKIEQGVILMCTPDNFFQRFIINGAQFREYKWKWLDKVDHYYWLKNNESVT
jgi:genome maintenance exonuclease 1